MPYATGIDRRGPRPFPSGGISEELREKALALAAQGDWAHAAKVNQELLLHHPKDTRTLNRLGKCMTELGRYEAATACYKRTLVYDHDNEIARKSLGRLALLGTLPAGSAPERTTSTPRSFIIDAGRSTVAVLRETANPEALAASSPGAELDLRAEGGSLYVRDRQGALLGALEPQLAQRLLALLKAGNTYAAALASVTEGRVSVVLRETFRHPSQAHTSSFALHEAPQVVPTNTKSRGLESVDEGGEDGDEEWDDEQGEVPSTLTLTSTEYPEAEASESEERDPFADEAPRVPDNA